MSKKSIKKRIIASSLIMVLIPLMVCGTVAMMFSYNGAMKSAETNMEVMAVLCSNSIQWEVQTFKTIARETGCNPDLSNPSFSNEEKDEILKAIPHKDCRADASENFSLDCINPTQEYSRISRRICAR